MNKKSQKYARNFSRMTDNRIYPNNVTHSDVQRTDTRTLDFSIILCIFQSLEKSDYSLVMTTSIDTK